MSLSSCDERCALGGWSAQPQRCGGRRNRLGGPAFLDHWLNDDAAFEAQIHRVHVRVAARELGQEIGQRTSAFGERPALHQQGERQRRGIKRQKSSSPRTSISDSSAHSLRCAELARQLQGAGPDFEIARAAHQQQIDALLTTALSPAVMGAIRRPSASRYQEPAGFTDQRRRLTLDDLDEQPIRELLLTSTASIHGCSSRLCT